MQIELIKPYSKNAKPHTPKQIQQVADSIKKFGFIQSIVTVYDKEHDKYIIVDGFHRYFVCKSNKDIAESTGNQLPIVIIDKSINDRMASTIRHNRARGKHNIAGMSTMVFNMLYNGWKDEDICNELGMEAEEILRLKHITGFSKLFEDQEYKKAWESKNQVRIRTELEKQK